MTEWSTHDEDFWEAVVDGIAPPTPREKLHRDLTKTLQRSTLDLHTKLDVLLEVTDNVTKPQ